MRCTAVLESKNARKAGTTYGCLTGSHRAILPSSLAKRAQLHAGSRCGNGIQPGGA